MFLHDTIETQQVFLLCFSILGGVLSSVFNFMKRYLHHLRFFYRCRNYITDRQSILFTIAALHSLAGFLQGVHDRLQCDFSPLRSFTSSKGQPAISALKIVELKSHRCIVQNCRRMSPHVCGTQRRAKHRKAHLQTLAC